MTTVPVTPRLRARPVPRAAATANGRTLRSYLLVPRPKDLVKALVVPLTFALGAAAAGGATSGQLGRALLVWFALELLVYQARYQWNDIRGFAADQAHPEAASRGRLPGPVERGRAHITASLVVMAVRLGATAALALAIPELRGILLLMTVGVFGVAFVYEHVRSAATGRTTDLPVPLHPSLLGLWVVVGAGYAVRGMVGLSLAVELGGQQALVGCAAVAMWALGVVFVTCRWALEAMCFATFRGGHVEWDAGASKAREHTLGLVRWLPSYVDLEDMPATHKPADWHALRSVTPLGAPWHLALGVAAAAAAVSGRLLVGPTSLSVAVTLAVVGAMSALVLTGMRHRWLGSVLAAAALAGLQWGAGLHRPVVASLPWLVVAIAYACFTAQCASEIGRPLRRLEPLLRG